MLPGTRVDMIQYRALILCTAALMLAGCASVPEAISTPVAGPDIGQVQASPDNRAGTSVRWGGTISAVRNQESRTEITVVARPLTRRGEPLGDEPSTGRFVAAVDRFLDPEEYKPGRRVTAVGTIEGIRSSRIGEFVYDYPVVRVSDVYLWEEYVRRDPYRYPRWPYYWDPYHRPFHWPYHHFHGHLYDPWY